MVKRGFDNNELRETLVALKRAGKKKKLWKSVADILGRPTRKRPKVNLGKINKYAGKDYTIIVPGVVLGMGNIEKPMNIISFKFSDSAIKKIKAAGGKPIYLNPENIKNKIDKPKILI